MFVQRRQQRLVRHDQFVQLGSLGVVQLPAGAVDLRQRRVRLELQLDGFAEDGLNGVGLHRYSVNAGNKFTKLTMAHGISVIGRMKWLSYPIWKLKVNAI